MRTYTTADFDYKKSEKAFYAKQGLRLPDDTKIAIVSKKSGAKKIFEHEGLKGDFLIYSYDGIKIKFRMFTKVTMTYDVETISGMAGEPMDIILFYIDGKKTSRERWFAGATKVKQAELLKLEKELSESNYSSAVSWVK